MRPFIDTNEVLHNKTTQLNIPLANTKVDQSSRAAYLIDHGYTAEVNCVDNVSETGTVSDAEETVDGDNYEELSPIPVPPDLSTISELLEQDITGKDFTCEIPSKASFIVDSKKWEQIISRSKGRALPAGEWQPLLVYGLKESNKFCVINFNWHKLATRKNCFISSIWEMYI